MRRLHPWRLPPAWRRSAHRSARTAIRAVGAGSSERGGRTPRFRQSARPANGTSACRSSAQPQARARRASYRSAKAGPLLPDLAVSARHGHRTLPARELRGARRDRFRGLALSPRAGSGDRAPYRRRVEESASLHVPLRSSLEHRRPKLRLNRPAPHRHARTAGAELAFLPPATGARKRCASRDRLGSRRH